MQRDSPSFRRKLESRIVPAAPICGLDPVLQRGDEGKAFVPYPRKRLGGETTHLGVGTIQIVTSPFKGENTSFFAGGAGNRLFTQKAGSRALLGLGSGYGANAADKIVWLLFCATCAYLAFLHPYVTLIPGERANVFAGFLCAFTFAAALLVADPKTIRLTKTEVAVSLVLVALAVVSGLLSPVPWSSSIRAIVMISSMLGGFWCARILINSGPRQTALVWLLSILLGGVTTVSLWSYCIHGDVYYYLYANPHQIVHMVFLLLIGPLVLISRRKPLGIIVGVVLMGLACTTLFLTAVRYIESGVMIPFAVVCILGLLGLFRSKTSAGYFVLIVMMTAVAAYFLTYLSPKAHSGLEYQSYRIESYPFSFHVAKKHPLFGIGLRAPRNEFLADYEVRHPALSKKDFTESVDYLVTPENIFLALMTGAGVPFVVLYCVALIWLLIWLLKNLFRGPPQGFLIPPWALWVPISASLLHSLTTDTFMLPQLAWYFHLLLGIIPKPVAVPSESRVGWAWIAAKAAALTCALAIGIFLGTSSYFSPEKLPSADTVRSFLREVPVVKLLFYEKPQAIEDSERAGSGEAPRTGELTRVIPDSKPEENFGNLIVNIDNYKGSPVNWAIMIVLDNSKSMAEEIGPSGPKRQEIAFAAINSLAREINPNSKLGLRTFTLDVLARSRSQEIPLRVSRILLDWTEKPGPELTELLKEISFKGDNSVCAATRRSLQADFHGLHELTPRIAIITDGRRDCSFGRTLQFLEKRKPKQIVKLDVIGIDMPRPAEETYSKLASEAGGSFLNIAQMTETETLSKYVAVLQKPRLESLELRTEKAKHRIMSGEKSRLEAGSYTIVVPEIEGLDPANRTIKDFNVIAGKTTVLNLAVKQGRLTISESEETE
ncbi:MAG: hypothetical protein ACLQPD_06745 [Desulfomonilaceae bacterium]